MGIWEAFSDIVEAVTPWSVVEAEAPAEEPQVRESLFFFSGRGSFSAQGALRRAQWRCCRFFYCYRGIELTIAVGGAGRG